MRSLTGETAAGDRYGYQDGAFAEARFRSPAALTLSPDGDTAYVADTTNGFIRVLDLVAETVSTLCGCCGSSVTADNLGDVDGVGTSARFNLPQVCRVLFFSFRALGLQYRRVVRFREERRKLAPTNLLAFFFSVPFSSLWQTHELHGVITPTLFNNASFFLHRHRA